MLIKCISTIHTYGMYVSILIGNVYIVLEEKDDKYIIKNENGSIVGYKKNCFDKI